MMSVLSVQDGPSLATCLHALAGRALVKQAGVATPVYNLAGRLYLSKSNWLLLSVPNALVHGVFAAMDEPGIELPPSPSGKLEAHITVFSDADLEAVGGPDKITERGKMFHYSIGKFMSVEPKGWPNMSKAWFLQVYSPELQALRRSYGLSSLPHGGEHDFHITCAVRRKGVLGRNERSKVTSV